MTESLGKFIVIIASIIITALLLAITLSPKKSAQATYRTVESQTQALHEKEINPELNASAPAAYQKDN